MNEKLIAVAIICWVTGIGVGYAISLPQISELRSELSTLTTNYNSLNETHNKLATNYTLLMDSMGIRFMKMPSASMEPTLKVGDVVVVRRVADPCEIQVGVDGDIIAFYRPVQRDIIIHRATEKILTDDTWYFRTKGDAFVAPDPWSILEDDIIGKVVAIISQPS